MARSLAGLCLALALVALAGRAHGQPMPRVSTGPFTGTHETSARDAVDSTLTHHDGREIRVVPALDYIAAAQRLGVDGMAGDEDVLRVARDQHLDFVVVGSMARRGRGYFMRLRVLNGQDASTVGTASWELRAPSEAADVRDEIWQQLSPYLLGTAASAASSGTTSSTTAGARGAASATTTAGSAGAPSPSVAPAAVSATASTLGFLTFSVAGGGATRSWHLPVLGEMSERGYDNGGYGELGGQGMLLYRWSNDRAGAGIGVGGALPVAISSRGFDADGSVTTLPTQAFEVWGGFAAAYRAPAGGWGVLHADVFDHSFTVDTSSLPMAQQLAPMTYIGFRAQLEGALPLYLDANSGYEFDLVFGGEFRLAGVGNEIRSAFGDSPGTTVGLGAEGGLAVLLDGVLPGLSFRATAQMLRYRTSFAGRYRIGPASDSVDDYAHFQGALSYSFGVRRPARAAH